MEQLQEEQRIISCNLDDILSQVSWKQLSIFIKDFKSMRKAVYERGIRVLKKNRVIILPVVKKKCIEDEKILHTLFALWFNEQKEYFDCLEQFFQSDEHAELLNERGRSSSEYVFNDEYFARFIDILKSFDIDKFLLLSPVFFTSAQKEQLGQLRDKQNEPEAVTQLRVVSEPKDGKQADGILLTKGELKHHRRELKKYQNKIEKLEKENSRLRSRQKEYNNGKLGLKKRIDEIEDVHAGKIKLLIDQQAILQRKNAEQGVEIKRMSSRLVEKSKRILNLEKEAVHLRKEKDKYFYQILSRLDTEELISSLNASDDVLDLLDTVIRPPVTDNTDLSDETAVSLWGFWNSLLAREELLVQNVLEISVEEVACVPDLKVWWPERKDDFVDLKCSLSTRIYLADMIFRIIQQYYLSNIGKI